MGGSSSQPVPPPSREKMLDEEQPPDKIQGLTKLITAESRRRTDVAKDQYDYTKENMQLLKHLFKKMDPTVMKTSANATHGEVQLSFKYEATRELLLIKVIKCRDLSAKDLRGKTADPYVKLYLNPFRSDSRQTQVAKRTLNPTYHEIITFNITDEALQNGKLVVQVFDKDIMDRDDFIGETVISLDTFDFTLQPVYTAWYTLKAETDLDITGNLQVALTFSLPSTLHVTVNKGENLTNRYEAGKPNPFVKLQIPGIKDMKQTEVKFETVDPVWDETFEFKISPEDFKERYLVFHVVDFDDDGKNDTLGQIIVDLNNFDPERGFHGNFELGDLKNSEHLRSRWFQQATEQEFREALIAHAAYRMPQFLFQKHSGTKILRVTSRKARAQAKLHIYNGIPVY